MLPEVVDLDLGPIQFRAHVTSAPHQTDAPLGHLWHWQGDGDPLLSLLAGVRQTNLGTRDGPAGAVGPAVDLAVERLDEVVNVQQPMGVFVEGAIGASGASVDGLIGDRPVRVVIVMSTDGTWMHRIECAVFDTDEGRILQEQILGSINVRPWEKPASA